MGCREGDATVAGHQVGARHVGTLLVNRKTIWRKHPQGSPAAYELGLRQPGTSGNGLGGKCRQSVLRDSFSKSHLFVGGTYLDASFILLEGYQRGAVHELG